MLIALKQPSIAVDVDCIEAACLLLGLLIALKQSSIAVDVDCIEAAFYCCRC